MPNFTVSRTLRGRSVWVVGAMMALLVGASAPAAAGAAGAETTVNAFSGALTSSIPIGVPGFRGLEPKLELGYSSSGGNGVVGVGWGLNGASVIERAAPGGGAPRFDASDVYRLDGNVLLPCAPGARSPSCSSGGTHTTRVESYARIAFDGTTWTVWQRTGVKAIYTARSIAGRSDFRWTLASVMDPKGNAVTYGWWCDGTNECYLDTVSYNGTTVKAYYETRGDVVTYAVGGGATCYDTCYSACYSQCCAGYDKYGNCSGWYQCNPYQCNPYSCNPHTCVGQGVGTIRYRVKTVDVVVAGSRARAYRLTYTTSGATARSLLAAVQQYGRDAVLDGSGTVTGGTALPATTLGYLAEANGSMSPSVGSLPDQAQGYAQPGMVGDFNGDGKADIAWTAANGYVKVALANGDGTFQPSVFSRPDQYAGYAQPGMVGDFDGDGKADIAWTAANGYVKVALSNGDGTFRASVGSLPDQYAGYDQPGLLGDFNGDGRTDIAWTATNGWIKVALANGDGTFRASVFSLPDQAAGYAPPGMVGDFNGDGKADIAWTAANGYLKVALANGDGTFQPSVFSLPDQYAGYAQPGLLGDFNGDGRTDIAWTAGNGYIKVALANADGTFRASVGSLPDQYAGYAQPGLLGDFNGDGRTDIAWTAGNGYVKVSRAAGTTPLLSSFANGLGGTTTITYTPSSTWANGYLPAGMVFQTVASITVSDGRGDVQTTNYTYQGARWRDATAADPVREFLGFRKATTTLGATAAYSETYYWQRAGTIAKPEAVYKRKANGAIMSFDQFRFTENASCTVSTQCPAGVTCVAGICGGSFTSLATEAWSFECNGHAQITCVDANGQNPTAPDGYQECPAGKSPSYVSGCRRVLATYAWDQYANLTTEYHYGDYDLAGDERTAVRSFAANPGAYIVGQPAYEEMRAGLGTGGTLLTRTRFLYDGASAEGMAPVTCPAAGNLCGGLLTKKGVWNDQTGLYVEHAFGYDSYGNETSVTDPLGQTTSKTYDPAYHLLTLSTTNPLGHVVQSGWDALGRLTSSTDPDGNVTMHSYDVFGRGLLTTKADGAQVKVEHLAYGDLANQRIRTSTLLAGGQWVWDDSYFDGLGRPYRTVSSTGVTADTIYGPTGKVWKQSLPYLAGDPVRYDVHGYDDL
ncbi:MAG TPA: FG-GAP-like repeat-containing protein, partial [Polyangia bacterium]